MRQSAVVCFVLFICIGTIHASAVVSDLALMARSTNSHVEPLINLPVASKEPLENKYRRPPRTLAVQSSASGDKSTKSESESSDDPSSPPLSLWRVQIILGVLILTMTIALVIAAIHTARVFGVISDSAQDATDVSISSKRVAANEADRDPESLTKLLTSHTMRGYGSMFSSALSGIVSPRRKTNADDKLIIQ